MKNQQFLIAAAIMILTFSCDENTTTTNAETKKKTAIGILHEESGKLYYAPGELERLLEIYEAEQIDSSTYKTDLADSGEAAVNIHFQVEEVADLDNLLEIYEPTNAGTSTLQKVYKNADCTWQHRGFVSPCLATFGPHRPFGASMIWTINKWKSCTDGSKTCIEILKAVGHVEYFPLANCAAMDSVPNTRPIRRMRCD